MKNTLTAFLFSFVILLLSCKEDEDQPKADPKPEVETLETITFSKDALYPEGIAYDGSSSNFLVSSISTGTVGKVDLKGVYSPFLTDNKLISTLGIHVDSVRNRVLVAVGDLRSTTGTTRDNLAAVAVFNLKSGALQSFIDLGSLKTEGKHLANDIAVDAQGNTYVTDSFSPIIYKVDIAGNASIFLENNAFKPISVGDMAGLNGIVFHPDGYLIVSKMDAGILFKVPIGNPSGFSVITSTASLPGDGLLLTKDKKLVVMAPTLNRAHLLSTTNAWGSATLEKAFETGNVWATTMTKKNNDIYLLYTNDVQAVPASSFVLKKLKF